MTLFFEIIIWIVMILSLVYLMLIAVFTYGWFSLKNGFTPETEPDVGVTIIVAVRNEARNINNLLNGLLQQVYPRELMEVLIIDDHSEDDTPEIVRTFAGEHPELKIILLSSPGTGKKRAVAFGIDKSSHRFIITTDGDTIPDKRWIRKMTAFYQLYQPKILLGPVVFINEKTFFQKMFSLDFISLVASGAGSAAAGLPFMGNAANMGFDKTIFSGKELQQEFASGDDVFLIHSVETHYGGKAIMFLKDAHALVTTRPPENMKAFFNQRIRWASKAKGYRDSWSVVVSLTVLLFNLSVSVIFLAGLWWHWLLTIWFLFVLLKSFIDFPLVSSYARLTGKSNLLVYLLPVELLYPWYVVITGIASLFVKYSWKGREGLR